MTFAHPTSLIWVASLFLGIWGVARRRHIRLRVIWLPAILLVIAASGPAVFTHPSHEVTVLVDTSPSTRGGLFRSRSSLRHRVAELVGAAPVRWRQFSNRVEPLAIDDPVDAIGDLPGDRTTFPPVTDQPVLLFSDGNFPPSTSPVAINAVIDPLLSDTQDAAVQTLAVTADRVTATISNSAKQATLRWGGSATTRPQLLPSGKSIASGRRSDGEMTAHVFANDRWPENDSLSIVSPPKSLQRWWVGNSVPPVGWLAFEPGSLPFEMSDYLNAGFVAIDNVSADELNDARQESLRRYVEDFGGGLLIIGGDRAFAAGRYAGTSLQSLSPLSGYPPTPRRRWILLIDRSGSMSSTLDGVTALQRATAAAAALDRLPPADRVSVGFFANALLWVTQDASPADAKRILQNTADIRPDGPTNFTAALDELAKPAADENESDVFVLTDGNVAVDHGDRLLDLFQRQRIRLSLLTLAPAPAAGGLAELVRKSGGRFVTSSNWIDDIPKVASELVPATFTVRPSMARYRSDVQLPDRAVIGSNETWPREASIALTSGDGPRAARWQRGAGRVGAIAYSPNREELDVLGRMLAAAPADPTLQVAYDESERLRITVDAISGDRYRNELKLTLTLGNNGPIAVPIVSPGHYEMTVDAPSQTTPAILRNDGVVVDRRVIAGHYPPEFARIGNDLANLRMIADQSGGDLIVPTRHSPIDFHWPAETFSLTSWFAAAGAAGLAAACYFRRF